MARHKNVQHKDPCLDDSFTGPDVCQTRMQTRGLLKFGAYIFQITFSVIQ
jgi:hypothetical protein